jgi:hypothetical protein
MIRGDGVGIEVCAHAVRGVRLAHDEPGRVVAAGDIPVHRSRDDLALLDALVRLHGRLGATTASTRLAWFPDGATLQRHDVTGRSGPELNALRRELAVRHDIVSTMLVGGAARRFMLALRWDHTAVRRLEHLAERAGFVDVSVEPAPVSLTRVLPTGSHGSTGVARRDAVDGDSWVMVSLGGVPVAAGPTATASRPAPGLTFTEATISLHRLDAALDAEELADLLDEITDRVIVDDGSEPEPVAEPVDTVDGAAIHLAGEPYPPYPAHDLRSADRQAVALGAAAGAAGLAGRLGPVDLVGPAASGLDEEVRPWAVERIGDPPEPGRRRLRWRRG